MRKPEIIVIAGPNGSGKSTITENIDIVGTYINADDIVKDIKCSNLEAAQRATELRESFVAKGLDFTFETVLSSRRNLNLLIKAKEQGFFIKCFYMITISPEINKQRVITRVEEGGHNVPADKIVSRYHKCLQLIPELIEVCDVIHIYDNTIKPIRIFKKKKSETFFWNNELWTESQIRDLVEP